MNLNEHFRRATEGSGTDGLDVHRLARVARLEGIRARRRRRGTALLGSAALVGMVAGGSAVLLGHDPDRAAAVSYAGSSPSGAPDQTGTPVPTDAPTDTPTTAAPTGTASPIPTDEPTGTPTDTPTATDTPTDAPSDTPTEAPGLDLTSTRPFSGRSVAAALRYAVAQVEPGRAGSYAGQSSDEAYGQLEWSDADGLGVSVVGVNVQPGMDFVSSCTPGYVHCTRARFQGGTLTTYEEHTRVTGGVGISRVADLLRADGTRIVVNETNGYDLPRNQWDVTRPQPPLSFADLTRVVSQWWWGAELPTYFIAQGQALAPYDDLGSASAVASPGSPATPSAK